MSYYDLRAVARLLALEPPRVRAFVKAGFVKPQKNGKELLFSFQDLVVLRTAKALRDENIPTARIKRALTKLAEELPQGRPLTSVRIAAEGGRIVVHDEEKRYQPETGQLVFDFGVSDLVRKVAPLARTAKKRADLQPMDAEQWYALGCELEVSSIDEARDAYRRAIELEPMHADAHNNLGRLLHEAKEHAAAEAHYRLALEALPQHATAWFNLGVVLEDAGKHAAAADAYEQAIKLDRQSADAHYNAARLYQKMDRPILALKHIRAYQKLNEQKQRS
ncbi:MAG: tetratricopeptide repeat protein [Deltaproteobacteria bacterium]|nr:tetratricopeptide repeat protein [Deltaproteobacteria bacterium]